MHVAEQQGRDACGSTLADVRGFDAARVGRIGGALVAGVAVLALVVSRRPEALLLPQFWAEDGTVWYAQAYNHGALAALVTPWTGYVQTFSRLVAALSLCFDLAHAPLVFNVTAVVAQSLAPLLLVSSRFASVLPDVRLRLLAALLLIGAPNSFEIQSNVTNAQTHFALLALLIVIADPPRTLAWQVFDLVAVVLGGLSGPTCVLLVPVATVAWWRRRGRWPLVLVLALALPARVQTATYLTTGTTGRFTTPLGASVVRLVEIIGGQVFYAGTLGTTAYAALLAQGAMVGDGTTLVVGIAGIVLVARALWISRSLPLRLFTAFAVLALAAALASPVIDPPPRWASLRLPWAGVRYFAPPILAYLAALLWSAAAEPRAAARWIARTLLAVVVLVGMPRDWRVPAEPDLDFPRHAAAFAAAPAGRRVAIPITPPGWIMRLRKH